MNNWHTEFMAEYDRQHILEEAENIQLEGLALQARVARPGLFARTMFTLANWMISTGSQLRRRYEIPSTPCNNAAKPAAPGL
jgi:hypothetical protein